MRPRITLKFGTVMVVLTKTKTTMRKSWISLGVICLSALFLTNCGEDEVPLSTIEFDQDQHDGGELSVFESNGTLSSFHPLLEEGASGVEYEVEISLNRPVAETTVIRFSTSGTATRSTATEFGDYDILTDGELLVIEKGESSAIIPLVIYEDYNFEIESGSALYEAFTIELEEIIAGSGKLGEFTTFDVFINEDDPIILLSWDPLDYTCSTSFDENDPRPCQEDMDIIVWMDGEQLTTSASASSFEGLNLPAGLPNAEFGFSYTYYSGTSNNLEFYVDIINLGGNLNGSPDDRSYTKVHTQANINAYDVSGNDPIIVQTMDKNGLNYTGLTDITVPTSGSRLKTGTITIQKGGQGKYPIQFLDKATLNKLSKLSKRF
jgi:hypothetical protein